MRTRSFLLFVAGPTTLFAGLLAILLITVIPGDTYYSIAIDSASGLHPPPPSPSPTPTDLSLLARPQFNLTFRVTTDVLSRRRACANTAGTYAEVSYRCVPLASSAITPRRRICVTPRKPADVPMLATGARVRLPGYMMDSLAADLRSGVAAFGVTLRQSNARFDGEAVARCGARRVGDAAARCDTDYSCPDGDPTKSSPDSAAPSPTKSSPDHHVVGTAN